jgi:hypothetical protein
MLRQSRSTSLKPNPQLTPLARKAGEGNIAWGQRALAQMRAAGPAEWTCLALLGGVDTMAFHLRVAQSHLRGDLLPSYWSEALLILRGDNSALQGARAVHVPLLQPGDAAYPPLVNGVVEQDLSFADDPRRYPNVALVAVPVAQEKIEHRLHRFRHARSTLDGLEHVLRWLAFAWSVAHTGNPLHENYGLPSACMLETLFAAEDFDLTPGLESRASCPEAIWSSAKHWHDYFEQTGGRAPIGRFVIGHSYPIDEGKPLPDTPATRSRPKK